MTRTVMISSTSLDLPEHRKAVMDACLRHDFLPKAMEHLPARDADAIKVSMEMVEQADVYVGIYGWRYGHIPKGHTISITEMELDCAVRLGKEILIFLIHEDHPITIKMVESGTAAQKKLKALKARASKGRGCAEFKSVDNLHSLVGQALAACKAREPEGVTANSSARPGLVRARQAYIEWLRRSCESVELLGLDLKLAQNVRLGQVYVPAVVPAKVQEARSGTGTGLERRHDLLLHRLGDESLYVPGAPGSGKSTFCRWLALCVANGETPAHPIPVEKVYEERLPDSLCGRFPLLCHLRDWVGSDAQWIRGNGRWTRAQLENSLAAWLDYTHPGGLKDVFLGELVQGRCLLIFDGMDEVPESVNQGRDLPRRNLLTGLSNAMHDWMAAGNRVLITSRPYGVTDAERRGLGIPGTTLEELSDMLQQTFVRRWYAAADPARAVEKAAALNHHLSERRDLDELRPNPMLLTALCVKFDEGQRLPSDFYHLFKAVIQQVLHMRYQNTEPRERAYARLAAVALAMHRGGDGSPRERPLAAASLDEVDRALAAHAALATTTEQGADQARAMREDLLSNSGLLLPRASQSAAFYHLIFQDFFAADRARRTIGDLPVLLHQHAAAPEWRRTLTFLFCAVADEGSAERAVELYSQLLRYFEPAALVARPGAALLLADCLEVAHARGWNLQRFAQPLRQACDHALHHLPPPARAHLWRTLGRLGLDDRPGVGVKDGLPDIDWVQVQAGDFFYGDDRQRLPMYGYRMSRYLVTNVQFACFIENKGYENNSWWHGLQRQESAPPACGDPHHPRETVTWYEATAFCRWLDAQLRARKLVHEGEQVRLPNEHEWEKAARGTDGREHPWGDFAECHANIGDVGPGEFHNLWQTSAVGIYPQGASPYGVLDAAGNVWEYSADRKYADADKSMNALQVLRGGSWRSDRDYCRCTHRNGYHPLNRRGDIGFRLCCGPPLTEKSGHFIHSPKANDLR